MYKLFLITLFTTILYAANPTPYAVLGDIIYNNVDKIEGLKALESYKIYEDDIDQYVRNVDQTKEEGYKLQKSSTSVSKKEYLNKLRALSKQNDFYLRSINVHYNDAMKNGNYELFSQIINSELIDTQSHKKEIIDYYYSHQDKISKEGVIDAFLQEDARLKALKDAQKRNYKTKKQLEEEKIKRIRENDKLARQKLEESLQKDLNKKKEEIRKVQIRELSN